MYIGGEDEESNCKKLCFFFVFLYVVSCVNEPVIENPLVVPPTVEEEKPEVTALKQY